MATSVPLMCSPVASRRSISRGSGRSVMAAARSSRWSVVSPMARTTTTRSAPSRRSRAIRPATWRMRSASASEDPPYFWTMSRDMAGVYVRAGRAPARRTPLATTRAPPARAACTRARPVMPSSRARRSMAAAMVAAAAGSWLKAMTVEPAPDRQAPRAPAARAAATRLGQLRVGSRAVGLVESVDRGRGEQVEAALAERRHGEGRRADVVDGVREGHLGGQGRAHGRRGEVPVRDVERGQEPGGRLDADGLRLAVQRAHHAEARRGWRPRRCRRGPRRGWPAPGCVAGRGPRRAGRRRPPARRPSPRPRSPARARRGCRSPCERASPARRPRARRREAPRGAR